MAQKKFTYQGQKCYNKGLMAKYGLWGQTLWVQTSSLNA